eukprot:CAMPEP_0198650556 /NCGR_PEP_ID=MMETSP1467-20131203/5060_1 /TAXON_ID=1462469 /ORGANISM="unid. sp., Strain CCMP2135" /LENGTH=311 /DNA_ID=CAMNT_0044386413 /DNA_START=46 /DNA_END=981 /DNA_ORIENTATION=-
MRVQLYVTLCVAVVFEGVFSFLFASLARRSRRDCLLKPLRVAAFLALAREIDVIYRLAVTKPFEEEHGGSRNFEDLLGFGGRRYRGEDGFAAAAKAKVPEDIVLLRALCHVALDVALATFATTRDDRQRDRLLWLVLVKFAVSLLSLTPFVYLSFDLSLLACLCRLSTPAKRFFYGYAILRTAYLAVGFLFDGAWVPAALYVYDRSLYATTLIGLLVLLKHFDDPLRGHIQLADIVLDDQPLLPTTAANVLGDDAADSCGRPPVRVITPEGDDQCRYVPPPGFDDDDDGRVNGGGSSILVVDDATAVADVV